MGRGAGRPRPARPQAAAEARPAPDAGAARPGRGVRRLELPARVLGRRRRHASPRWRPAVRSSSRPTRRTPARRSSRPARSSPPRRATGMPDGVFSMVHGPSPDVGQALVAHPAIQAVGFTGSFRGGKALVDAAARRAQPIPVFAEMGSANPVFVLPDALATRGEEIAKALAASVTLGSGQFCTNPGSRSWPIRPRPSSRGSAPSLAESPAGTMVHAGIKRAYDEALTLVGALAGREARGARRGARSARVDRGAAGAGRDRRRHLRRAASAWARRSTARPASRCAAAPRASCWRPRRELRGHLVATVHATERDLAANPQLLPLLARKAGRIVLNGMPTGVEVTHAMHHGGPWPATSDPRATSVGTAAILRFARPVCFQDVPDEALPEELRDGNPRGHLAPAGREPLAPAGARPRLRPGPRGEARPGGRRVARADRGRRLPHRRRADARRDLGLAAAGRGDDGRAARVPARAPGPAAPGRRLRAARPRRDRRRAADAAGRARLGRRASSSSTTRARSACAATG